MTHLVHLLLHYGVPLVALNVFLEQLGAPIPAVPILVVAGALSRNGRMSSTDVLMAAVAASVVADYCWFLLGRLYGYRVLRTLCRISLSPDSCVRDTEARFQRWGLKSLLVAKFVPGFSTVAPPLAGVASHSSAAFLLYDTIGAFLWAGSAVALGRAFHTTIARILTSLEDLGWWALVIVGSLLLLFVVFRWWQRARFLRGLRIARITPEELLGRLERGEEPVIADVRTGSSRKGNPKRIPTARIISPEDLAILQDVAPDREIVLYCT